MTNTYETRWVIYDIKTGIKSEVPENGAVVKKTPREVNFDQYQKNMAKKAKWSDYKKLIDSNCGGFHFYFYNQGLSTLPIKESIKSRFLYLCTYSCFTSKGSYLSYDKNGVRIKKEDVITLLHLSDREAKETIKTLIEVNLLYEDRGYLKVNSLFVFKGTLSEDQQQKEFTRLFSNGIRELYLNCEPKQHKQLYYLFRLLPYTNKKYNVICQNPDEGVAEDVIPFKLSEICEVFGCSAKNPKRIKNELYKLRVFNQYAIKGIDGVNGMWFKINPRISYAGKTEYNDALMELLCSDFTIN